MKTTSTLVAVLMAALSLVAVSLASEKGAEKLTGARPFVTGTPSASTMNCGKCAQAPYKSVDLSARGTVKDIKTVIGCTAPKCEDRLIATGHGKGKVETVVHRCQGMVVARNLCCK